MSNQSREKLVNDIENRLDDFFGEDQDGPAAPPAKVSMEKLKSVILSIDWEITEACLDDLTEEINVLMPRYEHDRLSHTLLRMLRAVGGYIRKRKAQSHPDAIKRIMSAFASLEHLTAENPPDEELKKKIVAKEIAAFKKLKQQVDAQRGIAGRDTKAPDTPEEGGPYVERHKFEQAMSAVEERLNSQVTALKAQLVALQNELDTMRSR